MPLNEEYIVVQKRNTKRALDVFWLGNNSGYDIGLSFGISLGDGSGTSKGFYLCLYWGSN